MKKTSQRFESGLLWKNDRPNLPNNFRSALSRFLWREQRLLKDPVHAARFASAVQELFDLGFAHRLTEAELSIAHPGIDWILPLNPAHNPNKPEKVRPVFDASAVFHGTSLNQQLLKGPDLLNDMVGILLRFRQYAVALSADIVKMFLQVRVRAADASAFRFLWRSPGSQETPFVCQMDVQIFGAICSPFICAYVLREAAKWGDGHAEFAIKQIEDHFYVDNWLTSFPTVDEATRAADIMFRVLAEGGFTLAQWGSSDPEVLLSLPGSPVTKFELDRKGMPVERTLGISLDYGVDAFKIVAKPCTDVNTRRELLRAISTIFDPIGFLSPVLINAKVILQDVCRAGTKWDESLTCEHHQRWTQWTEDFAAMDQLHIPRCFFRDLSPDVEVSLHFFADASNMAFGPIAYLTFSLRDEISTAFVMSKTRVTPIKYVSVARLELCAALLAVRLSVIANRELRLKISRQTFWSDSITVLRWVKSKHFRFHAYVGNRIGEILDSSRPEEWRYVPSAQNPTDDCSRGQPANSFSFSHRFFNGLAFLKRPADEWPPLPDIDGSLADIANDPDIRDANWTGALIVRPGPVDELVNNTSDLFQLLLYTARVLQFIHNCRKPAHSRRLGEISVIEIQQARSTLIKIAQSAFYADEIRLLTKKP